MKKILILLAFGISFTQAQVVTNQKTTINSRSNAFLDASQNASSNTGSRSSQGRALGFPETDLRTFQLNKRAADGINFPSYYDGMLVYNTADSGSTSDPNITQTDDLTPGFYYFSNPDGKKTKKISEGKWVKILDAKTLTSSVTGGKFWSLSGNTIDENTDFIGTTNDQSLIFKTDNIKRLTIGGKDGALSERVGTKTDNFDFVLKVYGKARFSEGIVTEASTYPDYVFDNYFTGKSDVNPDYKFKKLNEVEAFIKENNHLPGVTKIDDLAKTESGYEVDNTKLSIQTLEKVEELYLHLIEQQKEIQALKAQIAELKK